MSIKSICSNNCSAGPSNLLHRCAPLPFSHTSPSFYKPGKTAFTPGIPLL